MFFFGSLQSLGSPHTCFRLCSAAALSRWNGCGWGSIGHARVEGLLGCDGAEQGFPGAMQKGRCSASVR